MLDGADGDASIVGDHRTELGIGHLIPVGANFGPVGGLIGPHEDDTGIHVRGLQGHRDLGPGMQTDAGAIDRALQRLLKLCLVILALFGHLITC